MSPGSVLDAMGALVSAVPFLYWDQKIDPGFVYNDSLQQALNKAVKAAVNISDPQQAKGKYAFAVADLTDDPNLGSKPSTPAYAGFVDTEQRRIASLAKLLPLYGAYQLRRDFRDLAAATPSADLPSLATSLRDNYWRINATTGWPPPSQVERPWVEKVLALAPPSLPNFVLNELTTDVELDAAHSDVDGHTCRHPGTSIRLPRTCGKLCKDPNVLATELSNTDGSTFEFAFREHLKLMAGWSDNVSASVVIESMGFPFLWALTTRRGLYRSWPALLAADNNQASPSSGLFLALDYNDCSWPTSSRRSVIATGLARDRAKTPTDFRQGGCARSVAALMTALGQERLVIDSQGQSEHEAHAAMWELLRKDTDFSRLASRGEGSPIGEGMATIHPPWSATQIEWDEDVTPVPPPNPTADLAVSKIGLEPNINVSNALLVRTTRQKSAGSVTITAVLVGINNVDDKEKPLKDFGAAMAKQLDALHGVTSS